jgi:serine/threonine-protein kinase RsbW
VVRLHLPAQLAYRDLVLRTVSAACTLTGRHRTELRHQVVSAVSEAFNNVVLHAYAGHPGDVELCIETTAGALEVVMTDQGRPFDPSLVPAPELARLPETGLGLFIVRSFMDEVVYTPGPPNVLVLIKRFAQGPSRRSRPTSSSTAEKAKLP